MRLAASFRFRRRKPLRRFAQVWQPGYNLLRSREPPLPRNTIQQGYDDDERETLASGYACPLVMYQYAIVDMEETEGESSSSTLDGDRLGGDREVAV